MKTLLLLVLLFSFLTSCKEFVSEKTYNSVRNSVKINDEWRFNLEDNNDYKKENYNHSSWRNIDLLHDWGVEGRCDTLHGTDWQSGYLSAGIG